MDSKVILKIFRFNSKSDYLPYYKKHVIKIDANMTVLDLLKFAKKDDKTFDFSDDINMGVRICNKIVSINENVQNLVNEFDEELIIDPLNKKYAIKDLIVSKERFYKAAKILENIIELPDLKNYDKYLNNFFASQVINLDENFLGDAVFLLVDDLIYEHTDKKIELLKTISKSEDGIWLHINTSKDFYKNNDEIELKIVKLKNMIIDENIQLDEFVQKQIEISQAM